MDALFADKTFWQYLGYLLGTLTGVLSVSGAMYLFAKFAPQGVMNVKQAWFVLRRYEPQAIEAVNDPTDKTIRALLKLAPTVPWSVLLPAAIAAAADFLDAQIGTPRPGREKDS
jgi:hypothetical protein